MDDFEFEYIGDDEALEESANLNEDFAPRSVRINRYGKKVRGKDFNWVPKINLSNPKQFKESNILEDLQTNYSVGKCYGSFTVLSSHEDSQAWTEIFSFIHSLNIHPKFRMSDGALSITKAGKEVFGSCELCKESKSVGHMFTEM